MAHVSKFTNVHQIDEELLVKVRYVPKDSVQRLFKGEVTGLSWGRWKRGEEGYLHVADAMLLIEKGFFIPINVDEYRERVRFLRSGGVRSLKASLPPKKISKVEHLKWVGEKTASLLATHGISTIEQVAELTVDDLLQYTALAPHISVARAEEIISDAKKHAI